MVVASLWLALTKAQLSSLALTVEQSSSTYMLTAVSAVIAGAVLTAYLFTKTDLGADLTMDIITAVVLVVRFPQVVKAPLLVPQFCFVCYCVLAFGLPLCFVVSPQYLDIPAMSCWLLSSLLDHKSKQNKYRYVF